MMCGTNFHVDQWNVALVFATRKNVFELIKRDYIKRGIFILVIVDYLSLLRLFQDQMAFGIIKICFY